MFKKHKLLFFLTLIVLAGLTFSACHMRHQYGPWSIAQEAACEASGLKERTCQCGKTEKQIISPLGHDVDHWVIDVAPECNATGIQKQICSRCDVTFSTQQLPASGHAPGEWITMAASTCLSPGLKQRACVDCNLTLEVETLPLGDHIGGAWIVDQAPTPTEEGLHHQICAVCRCTLQSQTMPPQPIFRIVLDAGHGGVDHGASFADAHEKYINLQVVYKLKALLEDAGAEVILTRTDDTFISLLDRAELANGEEADLFVSIHCNYYIENPFVTGFEAYYYTDPKAEYLADQILRGIKASGTFPVRNVKSAELSVLMNTKMPAVLLELGFLTNDQERADLCTDAYQSALAATIAESILKAWQ